MRFADAPATRCPLCETEGAVRYEGMRDRWHDAPGEYRLRECPACRLVWLDPRPRPQDLADTNTSDYYTHDETPAPPRESRARRVLQRAAGVLPIVREMLDARTMFLPAAPAGRLLDVGCGNGAFLALMQQRGWQVDGVEPDAAAARIAARAIGREVFAGALADAPFPDGEFAAITLSHVIEHVPDPVDTLQTCLRLLRPGGAVYVTTPNTSSLGRRVFGAAWLHWDPPRHLFLFNPQNLAEVFRRAGFARPQLRTISRGARWSWRAGHAISLHGRLTENGGGRTDELRAAAFHLREHFLAGPQGGEEVFAQATK